MEYMKVDNKDIEPIRFCKYCGEKIEKDAKFCSFCGRSVKSPKHRSFFSHNYFKILAIGLLMMAICGCIFAVFIVERDEKSNKKDLNDEIVQNQSVAKEKEKSVTEIIAKDVTFEDDKEMSYEENLEDDHEEKQENIAIDYSITEMEPYVMQGACRPICFVIQPYMAENVTDRSFTSAAIYLTCYSVENNNANVVYLNGYTLQYDSFSQDYCRLNKIMGHGGIYQLLSVINDNYFLNMSDFAVVNFSLFGNYAEMVGGIKIDIEFNETEFKQIQDLYENKDNRDEVIALLEKLKNDELFFYEDFEALSSICRLSSSITEEMWRKIGKELFGLLLKVVEANEYEVYDNFFTSCSIEELVEVSIKIKEDYVWNQCRSDGGWYFNKDVGSCFIPDDYIDYVRNINYLLHGTLDFNVNENVWLVDEKADEAREKYDGLN